MKLLLSVTSVSEDGAFGGPVSVAVNQARALASAGHSVTLVAATDGKTRLTVEGVTVVLLPSWTPPRGGFVLMMTPTLRKWLRRNVRSFDVVHIHGGRHIFDVTVAAAARRAGVPYVLQPHGMILPSTRKSVRIADQLAVRSMLAGADVILSLTDAETEALAQLGFQDDVAPIRNGLKPRSASREQHRSEVLFLARLHPRKRVIAFAEMAKLVHKTASELEFRVVGPDDGDLGALQDFISANPSVPLSYDGAIAPGTAPDHLAKAAVYVLPSTGEVFPMTVLESLSVGTPTIITSDCGIANELRAHNAVLVSNGTPEDLARKVSNIIADQTLAARLSSNGHRAINELYDIDVVAVELISHYETVQRRPRVTWITNASAPYRVPIWNELGNSTELGVVLLETDQHLAGDSANNRGRDWRISAQGPTRYAVSSLRTAAVKRGEARYYLGWVPRRWIVKKDAVLLGGWESPIYWLALGQAKCAGVRAVGFYESHLQSQRHARGPLAWARARYFRSLDAVVTPGPAATDALVRMGVPPARVYEGFNAVDITKIRAARLRKTPTQRATDLIRLLFVGQLIPRKNLEAVLRALADRPQIRLTVVGVGPLRQQLEDFVRLEVPDPSRVTFTGYVEGKDLPAILVDHDALVLPSTEEVWGLVVNEALAAGLRVIVSDRAGVAQSVQDHPGVFLCRPTSVAVGEALDRLGDVSDPILNPPVLSHTPERFAAVFRAALFGTGDR